MSRRGCFILGGGVLGGLLLSLLFYYAVPSQTAPAGPRPPELGGQQVPAKVYEIRFDQKYDLFCSFYREEPTIYRNCRILGFTGRGEESAGSGRSSASVGFAFSSSSGSASDSREFFDHWLVLELADGRLAYVPPSAVRYIEQASTGTR
jgi:hypothetical protein